LARPRTPPTHRARLAHRALGHALRLAVAGLLVLLAGVLAGLAEGGSSRTAARGHEREVTARRGPVRYTLEARLDDARHEVHGRGTIEWRNDGAIPQRELWLHAYLEAFRDSRAPLLEPDMARGFRGGAALTHLGGLTVKRLFARELDVDLWPRADRSEPTDVRVPLPRPVAPGETLTMEVEFIAALPSLVLRTGFAGEFHMVAQWFPKLAKVEPDGRWAHFPFRRFSEFYANFGDYDVTVEVPAPMVVGATGAPVESSEQDGRRRVRYLAERVHDFAFAAWSGFEEIRQMAGDVEVVALFPRGELEEAELELATAERGLRHYSERYGAYPYRRLTLVRPPPEASAAGGMEYPTLVTTGGSTRGRAVGVRALEALVLHELAHQWFQGIVASDENRSPALDEGLATYAEIEAMDAMWGGASVFDALGLRVSSEAVSRIVAKGVAGGGPLDRPAETHSDGRSYVGLVYARPATLLRMLAKIYGEDAMRRALRRYASEQRFAHPTPSDLVEVVRREVGEQAAIALRRGFEGARLDARVVRFASRKGSSRASWEGTVAVAREGSLEVPVELEIWAESGARSRLVWDAPGSDASLEWRGDSPIAAVVLDPEGKLLLDEQRRNDSRGAPRPTPRLYGFFGLALSVVAEVLWP